MIMRGTMAAARRRRRQEVGACQTGLFDRFNYTACSGHAQDLHRAPPALDADDVYRKRQQDHAPVLSVRLYFFHRLRSRARCQRIRGAGADQRFAKRQRKRRIQRAATGRDGDAKISTRLLFALCTCIAALLPATVWPQDTQPEKACPRGAPGDIPDSLRAVKDEAGATFYRHQSSPLGASEQAFFLYIGKKACEVWLRIRIQFPGDKPSGKIRIHIKADDKAYEFAAPRLTQSDDAGSRGYRYDELVEPEHLLMLFKVAASANATVRLESANGATEHVVSAREKQALTVVLGAYHSLGGKLSGAAAGDASEPG
jgi:hypothetical protein